MSIWLFQHRKTTIAIDQTFGSVSGSKGKRNVAQTKNISNGKGFLSSDVDIENCKIYDHFAGKFHRCVDAPSLTNDVMTKVGQKIIQMHGKQDFIFDNKNPHCCMFGQTVPSFD